MTTTTTPPTLDHQAARMALGELCATVTVHACLIAWLDLFRTCWAGRDADRWTAGTWRGGCLELYDMQTQLLLCPLGYVQYVVTGEPTGWNDWSDDAWLRDRGITGPRREAVRVLVAAADDEAVPAWVWVRRVMLRIVGEG